MFRAATAVFLLVCFGGATADTTTGVPQSVATIGAQRLLEIPAAVKSVVPTPEVQSSSWMLVDFESGWVLGSKDKDLRIEPQV